MMGTTNNHPKYESEKEENKPGQGNEAQKTQTREQAKSTRQSTRQEKTQERKPDRKRTTEAETDTTRRGKQNQKRKTTHEVAHKVGASPRLEPKCSPLSCKSIPVPAEMTNSKGTMQDSPPRCHPGPVTKTIRTISSIQKVPSSRLRGKSNQLRKPRGTGWPYSSTRGTEGI